MYYVYVLKSLSDQKHYTGMSIDLEKRLRKHNRGAKGTPSTRSRGPFSLVYCERVATRVEARRREKFLKSGFGREFIKNFVEKDLPM